MDAHSDDLLKRATSSFQAGRLADAEKLCRGILQASPGRTQAHVLLGRILQAAGKPDEAQTMYRAAALADRTCVDAWRYWSIMLHAFGHSQQAVTCLREALTYVPEAADLHIELGVIVLALGHTDEAAAHLEKAVAISPTSVPALGNLGIARKAQGRVDDAVACYRRALAIAPNMAALHNNLGDALKTYDMEAAISAFSTALRLQPDYPEALDNLGVAYFCQNRLREALECVERAIALRPTFNRAVSHKATLLFLLGRLPEAWLLHRRRFELDGVKVDPHGRFAFPIWRGEKLAGKSLLVWTEQGLGEEILQASMFRDARAAAARVYVECTPRILTLLRRSFPDIAFIPRLNPSRASEAEIQADYQAAAGDLGAVFRNTFAAFPRHQGYLIADAAKAAAFRKRYAGGKGNVIVGISWASYNAALGKEKTLALRDLAPILRVQGVTFINLQYRASPDEVAAVENELGVRLLTDPSLDPLGHIDDLAAQISALDLVISVSNTNVHLAGALNVPVWNIVPAYNASGMWHWFHDFEQSPWYPAMRIYRRRQENVGPLVESIAAALKNFAEISMY
jgi:tetratricopeptide (TPR) repeat protein